MARWAEGQVCTTPPSNRLLGILNSFKQFGTMLVFKIGTNRIHSGPESVNIRFIDLHALGLGFFNRCGSPAEEKFSSVLLRNAAKKVVNYVLSAIFLGNWHVFGPIEGLKSVLACLLHDWLCAARLGFRFQ